MKYSSQFHVPLSWLMTVNVLALLAVNVVAIQKSSFSIKEEEPIDSLVGVLSQKLSRDLKYSQTEISFQLIQKGHADYFKVSPMDGRVTVAQIIDREQLCKPSGDDDSGIEDHCQIGFTVSLLREGTSDILDIMQVTVNVLDVNDQQCRFEPSDQQTVYIPEDSHIGSSYMIPLNMPYDPDTGVMNRIDSRSIRLKSVDELDSARFFNLHITDRNSIEKPVSLHLSITRQMDYETVAVHKLIVTASDMTRKAENTCSLHLMVEVVDVNDNMPRFEKKLVQLPLNENTPIGSIVHNLNATDNDKGNLFSQLIYSLGSYTSSDVRRYFEVLPRNGSIVLKRKLSFAKKRKFEIPVVVRNPTDGEATTGQGDDAQINIFKDIPIETTAHDTARIIVSVIDVNDESPVISVYTSDGQNDLSIEENNFNLPSDFAVVSVTDGDAGENGKVECHLSNNVTDYFRLVEMSSSGAGDTMYGDADVFAVETLFKLSATQSFDRERSKFVPLNIQCKDLGSPQKQTEKSVLVRIKDQNDNPPKFDKNSITLRVFEDSAPSRRLQHYEITKLVAHDPDEGKNAEITYDLIQPPGQSIFKIDFKTGMLRSNGELDREAQERYQFTVVARDAGLSPLSATLSVDVRVTDYNDEPPTFSKAEYEFEAVEGLKNSFLIGVINAEDADDGKNGELRFRILANDLPAHYPISTGESSQQNWRAADNENLPYRLVPHFNPHKSSYEVGIIVDGMLDAEAIAEANQLASGGGVQLPEVNLEFPKREEEPVRHSFFVVAEDNGVPKRIARVRVTVNILDENDNSPIFHFPDSNNASVNVSYKEYVGFPFTRIYATDVDAGLNGTVQYFLAKQEALSPPEKVSQQFSIDRNTGYLSLKEALSSIDLGRSFQLHIIATDMATDPMQTEVHLLVNVDGSMARGTAGGGIKQWASAGFGTFGKTVTDSMVNFFIIIFIVAAAFIISAILLTAVCIVLRKSRQTAFSQRVTPKRDKKGQICVQQNSLSSSFCTQMNGIPVSYNAAQGYPVGKMYSTVPVMADYIHDQWPTADCQAMLSNGDPLVYTAIPSSLVNCSSEVGYQCNGGSEVVGGGSHDGFKPENYSYLVASANMSSSERQHRHPNRAEVTFTQYPGTLDRQFTSSSIGEARTMFRTSPFIPNNFSRTTDTGTAWHESQEVLHERSDVNGNPEGSVSNDQDSGHGDSVDTPGNGPFFPKMQIPSTSARCLGVFGNFSGLGPIYDEQIIQPVCSLHAHPAPLSTSSNSTSTVTATLPWHKTGADLSAHHEILPLIPSAAMEQKKRDNCSTFI